MTRTTNAQIDAAIQTMIARASGYDRRVLEYMRAASAAEDRAAERARTNARKADRDAKLRARLGVTP